jgi:hypothetical protein
MTLEPIDYRIVKNLQAALLAISTTAGYHYDVAALAVKLDPNHDAESLIAPDGPRPFILLELGKERWEYFPAFQVRITVPVTVHWVSESVPTDDDSRMQTYLRGCADVERAIAVDISRGGLATDHRINGRTLDLAVDGAQVWAMVETEVRINRTYGAPDS